VIVNSIQNVGTQPLAITATGLLTPWMDLVRQRLQRDTVMETVITSSPDSQPDDAAILASIARKDRQAFHQLYDRYAPIALGLAVRVLNAWQCALMAVDRCAPPCHRRIAAAAGPASSAAGRA
jgi:hypothetical protein